MQNVKFQELMATYESIVKDFEDGKVGLQETGSLLDSLAYDAEDTIGKRAATPILQAIAGKMNEIEGNY